MAPSSSKKMKAAAKASSFTKAAAKPKAKAKAPAPETPPPPATPPAKAPPKATSPAPKNTGVTVTDEDGNYFKFPKIQPPPDSTASGSTPGGAASSSSVPNPTPRGREPYTGFNNGELVGGSLVLHASSSTPRSSALIVTPIVTPRIAGLQGLEGHGDPTLAKEFPRGWEKLSPRGITPPRVPTGGREEDSSKEGEKGKKKGAMSVPLLLLESLHENGKDTSLIDSARYYGGSRGFTFICPNMQRNPIQLFVVNSSYVFGWRWLSKRHFRHDFSFEFFQYSNI